MKIVPGDLEGRLRQNEIEYIREALAMSCGNVAEASRMLGLPSPQSLWKKIGRFSINPDVFRPVNPKWGSLSVTMDTMYQPSRPACPICEKIKGDGFPELQIATDNRLWCWMCGNYWQQDKDGNLKKLGIPYVESVVKGHAKGKKITGSPGPPTKGTPGNPRVI